MDHGGQWEGLAGYVCMCVYVCHVYVCLGFSCRETRCLLVGVRTQRYCKSPEVLLHTLGSAVAFYVVFAGELVAPPAGDYHISLLDVGGAKAVPELEEGHHTTMIWLVSSIVD